MFKVAAKTRAASKEVEVTTLVSDFTDAEIRVMEAEALEKIPVRPTVLLPLRGEARLNNSVVSLERRTHARHDRFLCDDD